MVPPPCASTNLRATTPSASSATTRYSGSTVGAEEQVTSLAGAPCQRGACPSHAQPGSVQLVSHVFHSVNGDKRGRSGGRSVSKEVEGDRAQILTCILTTLADTNMCIVIVTPHVRTFSNVTQVGQGRTAVDLPQPGKSSPSVFVKHFPRYQDPFCLVQSERARSIANGECINMWTGRLY